MHFRRIACFLLGAWLAGSLFMIYVATHNFRAVDKILQAPPAPIAKMAGKLASGDMRILLRHLAGEENRLYFESWELAQLALGIALGAVLFLDKHNRLFLGLCGLLFLLVLFVHLKLTPEIVWLGRSIEFLPALPESPQRRHFASLHAAYGAIELVKILLLVVLTALLLRFRSRRNYTRVETMDAESARPKWVRS